jgi:predicted MPP superfamily phosphohydrolase
LFSVQHDIPHDKILSVFNIFSGAFVLFYIPKLVFIVFNIFDDIIFPIRKAITLRKKPVNQSENNHNLITRRKFLNQVGIIFAGVPFVSLSYGILHGRFDFTVREVKLHYPNLSLKFDGLKVIQISDFHIGAFMHYKNHVQEIVEIINEINADLILFTGDFVNNVSEEIDPFINTLKSLKARIGKYAILGNHDYGEYVPWESEQERQDNIRNVIRKEKEIGFDLLLDEFRKITIEDESIELIGIENWGLPPFPQYGDLEKAMSKTSPESFKVLLSHDPTHWDAQVLEKTNIDLTLSGHTHGAQFGIEIPGFRWSPATVRYKRWGGLYEEENQKLYINTGLGSIGYPGRVGMPPEITVFTLNKNV